jgi:CubicO group peptidase (beta-lactamase class C family)
MATEQAVGVSVAVVHDGRVLLARGYGIADRERGQSAAADTLFRIGSISKLFVWVAVMREVAVGRLDLDTDVNEYLSDLTIPATFPEPITLTDLMTHTPGFEDRVLGLFAPGPRTVGEFHDNLVALLPRRVLPPGQFAAYSNYGAALAAHVVETVSGQPWQQYLEDHILTPLGMTSTTGRQPVPQALADRLARGYAWDDGQFVAAPFEFVTLPPAGSISSTAVDMARFMLELTRSDDDRVLPARARAELFAPGFAHDPRLNGMLHGFYQQNSHGAELVGHGGDTLTFHSELLLSLPLRLGLYVSYNGDRAEARSAFVSAFLDRLFGPPPQPAASEPARLDRYVGFYSSLRVPASGHDKILGLLQTVHVTATPDGELEMATVNGPRRFVHVGDDLFAEVNGRGRIAFRGDGPAAQYLFVDSEPMVDYARVAPRNNPLLQGGLLAAVILLSAGAWLAWPVGWLRRRNRISNRGEGFASLLGLLNAALMLGYLYVIGSDLARYRDLIYGLPPVFQQAMWVPVALLPLLLVQLIYAARAWTGGWWWPLRRIHYSLLVVGLISAVAWAFYWHLTAIIIDV